MKSKKIGSIIVTYNPNKNIYKLINYLKNYRNIQIIIVDNSCKENKTLLELEKDKRISIKKNSKNYGIAKAINVGVKLLDEEIEWFFTFDQDSIPQNNYYENMIKYIENKDIGIITPEIFDRNLKKITTPDFFEKYSIVKMAIQSGMLIQKKAYYEVKGFNENLVIYYVDNDFVHKILKKEYKIIRIKNAILSHTDGKLEERKFLTKKIYYNNRNNLAIYFRSKNLGYMIKNYGIYYLKDLIYDLVTNLLFSDNKRKYFYYLVKGLKDSNKEIKYIEKF